MLSPSTLDPAPRSTTPPPPPPPAEPVPTPAAAASPAPPRLERPNGARRRKPSRRGWWLLLLAGIVAAGLGSFSWVNRPVAQVYGVRRGTALSAVYGTVRIEYFYQQAVKAENSGYIDLGPNIFSGLTSVGFKIDRGQLLGTIRDETTQRQVDTYKTELAAALAKQKQGPASTESLRSAQDNLTRIEKAGQSVAEGQRIAARNTVKQLEAAVQNETTELQRLVDQANLNYTAFANQLKRAEVHSPIDGYLVAAPPVDHQLVLQNEVLFTIATRDLYVSGQVNEEDVGALREGMRTEMKLYAYGDREFTGSLQQVLPNADSSNQRYTVIIGMNQPPDNLRAGLTGEMNILVGKHENALIIPARALRDPDERHQERIFIVDDGVIKPRTIRVGYRNPETIEILDGAKEGDQVVVQDQDLFATGARVRAVSIDPRKLRAQP